MEIKKNENTIEVFGTIKTIENAESIIEAIKSIPDDVIKIKIYDSYVIPSSIIGSLLRAIDNGKKVILGVKSNLLEELIKDLNLDKVFNLYRLWKKIFYF